MTVWPLFWAHFGARGRQQLEVIRGGRTDWVLYMRYSHTNTLFFKHQNRVLSGSIPHRFENPPSLHDRTTYGNTKMEAEHLTSNLSSHIRISDQAVR